MIEIKSGRVEYPDLSCEVCRDRDAVLYVLDDDGGQNFTCIACHGFMVTETLNRNHALADAYRESFERALREGHARDEAHDVARMDLDRKAVRYR